MENSPGSSPCSDIGKSSGKGDAPDNKSYAVMITDVVEVPSDTKLFEVIRRFKETKIGRLMIVR